MPISQTPSAARRRPRLLKGGGSFTAGGTDRGIDIISLALSQRKRAVVGKDATTLDAAEVVQISAHTFPNGCHMAEVEVDPDTGHIYLVCDDVGKAVNPRSSRGQVHGGVAQGYGQAVTERTEYDRSSGRLLSGSFIDYALSRQPTSPTSRSS